MKWRGRRESSNVRDLRGQGASGGGGPFGGGGGLRIPGGMGRGPAARGGGLSIVTLLIIGAIAYFVFGINPLQLLGMGGGAGVPGLTQGPQGSSLTQGQADELASFAKVVLADTEDVWNQVLPQQAGQAYEEPVLTLFTGGVRSACGSADSAMGPFYCPADRMVYVDLDFFQELETRFNAAGDFAQAYVIAHEVGHHIQTVLGISARTQAARARASQEEGNRISVMQELQADCFAGVWAFHAQRMKNVLEPGDVEEALAAAAAVGDDTIQRRSRGFVVPESFTHGTAEQRKRWFLAGFQSGDMRRCDTFAAADQGRL